MPVVRTPEVLGGVPRLEGHRISVLQVADSVVADLSAETVADQLGLSLAEVHEAMASYSSHPDEMDELRARDEELEAELADRSDVPRNPQ